MTTQPVLTSRTIEVEDALAAMELFSQNGWTDGLPVVPPTEARVRAFLAAAQKQPGDIIGVVPARGRVVTAEKVAINAVMAGCLPEYMPVVVAAMEAMLQEEFNLHGCAASTGGAGHLVIVNGPLARKLGFNSGGNLFGQGWRANGTVGRAVRLILMNVCGAVPGVLDRSTLGHPGKYSYCFAELEEGSPWEPFHVQQGFRHDDSTVTVIACEAPHQVQNHRANTPEAVLESLAEAIAVHACNFGQFTVVFCPEHIGHIEAAGWSKARVRDHLWERSRRPASYFRRTGMLGRAMGDTAGQPDDELVPAVREPQGIFVLVGGGGAGAFSAVISPWGAGLVSRPVTRKIAV